jgi:pterin-4a-carbinolamine dehydratase
MASLAFISYRRTDSQQAALGLFSQLRARLGSDCVFMDRSGISAGDAWPERLRERVNQSTVVLALIGPGWLTSADSYGRRRLDLPNDWVRNELIAAIDSGKPVIPILIGSTLTMPPAEALPHELARLAEFQQYGLRDERWDADLNGLVELLIEQHGFREAEVSVRLPEPQIRLQPLTEGELCHTLRELPGWEPVESLIPGDYPKSRREIRKVYAFKSFPAAVRFMHSAIDPIRELKHHPRWENQWRTVTVYLSTWDIGFRVSRLDIDLARILDRIYKESTRPA